MTKPTCAELAARGEYEQFHTTKAGKPRVRNRFPGTCVFCGTHLEVDQGYIGKSSTNGWYVECALRPPDIRRPR